MNPEYDELLVLAETLGEVKSKTEKLEAEFSTQARPLEAATNALSAALSGIKALQFHVLDNNLGQLSARVEEMRKAVDEQVGVIALELKKADETNAEKAGQEAEALRSEIAALQAQLGTLGAQFSAQLERVEFSAKEEAKKLQLIPGPAGAAGASLNPRGTFIDGETYNRLDVVTWLGSSYIAAVDGVKEKPSKNSNQWQVLASRGSGGGGGVPDINAILPSQSGKNGQLLTTNGASASWGTDFSSALTISNSTASSSSSIGAFVVSGGVGIGGKLNVGLGVTIEGGSYSAGTIYRSSSRGIVIAGVSGTTSDLLLASVTGFPVMQITKDTRDVRFYEDIDAIGAINAGSFFGISDGIAAPDAQSGLAKIYVDIADGDLKVKFGDGIVKTIATDS